MSRSGIEPTSSSPGSQGVTLREFEAFQKSSANENDLRQGHLDERFEKLEQIINERFEALAKALEVADRLNQTHLDKLNGEQNRLASERHQFVSKEVLDVSLKEIEKRLGNIEVELATGTGRQGGIGKSWAVIVAVVGIVLAAMAILSRVFKP